MGKTHVLTTGALALAFAAPLSQSYLHHPMGVGTLFAFAGVTAGYGILPDLDHPQATLAHVLGPVTKSIARTVAGISGGHRKGTHTVWAAGLMVLLVTMLSAHFGNRAQLPITFIGFYLTAMVLKLAKHPSSKNAEATYLIEAAAATAACYYLIANWWWLPWAVGFGVIGHIVGDIMTVEGLPIFYPILPRFVVRVPVLGHTESVREKVFALALVPVVAFLILSLATGNTWYDMSWLGHPDTWRFQA